MRSHLRRIERTTLYIEVGDGLMAVTLNRPKTLNAISIDVIDDLNWALDQLDILAPQPRCVLLTGSGTAFCAGGDISAHTNRPVDAEPHDLGAVLHNAFNPLLLRLLDLPVPFVVAVNGAAAGAGCPLALCGDVVVAAQSAYFACGFARIGLMADFGATWLLPRLIGRARAHAMMMLDQRVPAETAQAWGMIHASVPDDALSATTNRIARNLADGATQALVATRLAVLAASASSITDALDREAQTQRTLGNSADFAEGIAAFFERRPAKFGQTSF